MFTRPRILHPEDEVADLTHASALLRTIIDEASEETFTLEWMINQMPKHSFGVILLLLAMLSLVPIISIVARILMLVLGLQIIIGYHTPVLPRRLIMREMPKHYLAHLDRHAIPFLQQLERGVRPRWPDFLLAARRLTAMIGVVLTVLSLLAPIPLANVPPAFITALMALAYIEHDGLLLLIALILSIGLLAALTIAFL